MDVMTRHGRFVFGSRGVRAVISVSIALSAGAHTALGADPKLVEEVESANQLYVDGEYQAALKAYTEAQSECPECAELAYNQGLTHYRLGDLAEARDKFNEALSTNDTNLESKAKYNLGNVAYSEALANQAEPQKAIQSARSAIEFYRDALELAPNDRDARANIETANRFLKRLQQQQQQNQDQQQQDQQNDQDQKQDQQEQNQQDQEQEDNDQQNDEQNSDQQQNEQSKEGENEQQQDQDQQQQQDDQQKQGGDQDQQQQADSDDQQGQSQQQSTEARELTEEEAERLLQAVRDKEAKRREELAERRKARRVTVDKDW